jgi:transposase-like protein
MTKRKTVQDAMEMRPKDLAKACGVSIHAVYKWRSLYNKSKLSDWRKHKIEFLLN